MVLLFLPTMAMLASSFINTTVLIMAQEYIRLPIGTRNIIVFKELWFSPKILPVVSIHTLCFIVIKVKWAPYSFEMKNKKFFILWVFMNELNSDIFSRMRKAA